MMKGSFKDFSNKKKQKLKQMFKDELKPGLIIDGQHRVSGTKGTGHLPFSVLLLPFASWGELAFQFIVNNSTAKKVGEGLLISIVGESLTPKDLAETRDRLNKAGVKVDLIKAVMIVHKDLNPFVGMLDFKVLGEKGFLASEAMTKKVIGLWWGTRGITGNKPNTQMIKVDGCDNRDIYDLFCHKLKGKKRGDRIRLWQEELWFEFFKAFWEAVKEHFCPRLWPASKDDWLIPNKTPETPEQKEKQKLMRVTHLGLLQTAVLKVWADNKLQFLGMEEGLKNFKIKPDKFKKEIKKLLFPLKEDFFLDLNENGNGLDGSKSHKVNFVKALVETLSGQKSWPKIKADSYFWGTIEND